MLSAEAIVSFPDRGLIAALSRLNIADGFLSQHLLPLGVVNMVTFCAWSHFLGCRTPF